MRADPEMLAGRYRILAPLGRGGMGAVWRAWDCDLDRTVAVKELQLPEEISEQERQVFYSRLEREARAAARLKHPGIVTVYDRVLGDDDRPWIVMEYVKGGSLQDLLAEHQQLPVATVAAIGAQMVVSLRLAHEHGVVHRDIKPANVLLEDDRVVLTDFGIASLEGDATLTRSGSILGTPAFMAPEQVRGLTATPETDLWSLGATLYTAVEGRKPFGGANTGSIFIAIATEDPAPCLHAGPLTPVLTGLLRKDPAQRLTAEAAHELLAGLARDAEPLPPPPVRFVPPTRLTAADDGGGRAGHQQVSAPARNPPAQGRAYLLGGLAAVGMAAVVAIPTWLLWPESAHDTGAGARGIRSSASTQPSPSAPAYTPSAPAPTYPANPAHTPLDRAAIGRVFQVYMNGLANHDMTALRRGTCPRLRSTLLGFELNGYYVARWQLLPYEIPTDMDRLSVEAKITQRDPGTGKLAGDINNQWIVERDADQNYWVCGWLNQR